MYENEGKRSGAYSWGAFGTHPYVLLNHKDNLNSMFTLDARDGPCPALATIPTAIKITAMRSIRFSSLRLLPR